MFFLLFFSPPRLDRSISWQQLLSSSGARRALGSSSAEGIGLQAQKSLHTVLLILFCRVASSLRVLPRFPAPTRDDACRTHPCPGLLCSSLSAGEHQRSRMCMCCYSSSFFGVCFCSFLSIFIKNLLKNELRQLLVVLSHLQLRYRCGRRLDPPLPWSAGLR